MREWNQEEIESGSMKWSLMTDTDRATMKWAIENQASREIKFLEIGTYNGSTAWGVKSLTEKLRGRLCYIGIDVMTHDAKLWPEATMIIGDSTKVFYLVPDIQFDILFIDGPHSTTNCMLDFLNYAPKVKVGGLILFHDASPASQCLLPFSEEKFKEYNERGWEIPENVEFGTAVLIALEKLGLRDGLRTDYELVSDNWSWEPYGGISIYRKLL